MNVNLTTLGKVAKLTVLNIYMPKGNTEKHKHKTFYAAIITHMKNMHKTYAENICIVGHHPTFQNQPRLHPQVMHQSCAYLQSLSTQADIMSRGPASTDIAYHIISIM